MSVTISHDKWTMRGSIVFSCWYKTMSFSTKYKSHQKFHSFDFHIIGLWIPIYAILMNGSLFIKVKSCHSFQRNATLFIFIHSPYSPSLGLMITHQSQKLHAKYHDSIRTFALHLNDVFITLHRHLMIRFYCIFRNFI